MFREVYWTAVQYVKIRSSCMAQTYGMNLLWTILVVEQCAVVFLPLRRGDSSESHMGNVTAGNCYQKTDEIPAD
jgi:hypothetical protein